MPTIQYPNHPNTDTAFVVQDDGTKNRALMTAPQDTSTLELPKNANSCKGYVTINGKKQRVVMTADVMGGGGSSYTAGTGIDITNDVISVTAPTLTNTSNQTQSLGILGNAYNSQALAVGALSTAYKIDSTAIGAAAHSYSEGMTAIGRGAGSSSEQSQYSIAIGAYSRIDANTKGAIQLGKGTNSTSGTFAVGLSTDGTTWNNYELLSADGTIPTARLTKVNTTITLTAAGWSNGSQTVSVSGITSTGVVFVSPDPTDQADYTTAGILCTAQATDSLTFTCDTTPSSDISVVVVQM